jgi:hypothetical protein
MGRNTTRKGNDKEKRASRWLKKKNNKNKSLSNIKGRTVTLRQ